jgi:hypothetical protein
VPDSGVIPPEDGGSPVQLDKTCPDVTATGVFDLPGCCLPTGLCGGSTHTLCGAGVSVPVACVSYDDIAASAASSFGNTVTVPDDPNIKCRYTAGPTTPGVRDASADSHITPEPDAKPPVPDAAPPKPDAAPPKTPDAAPTSEPDSGGSPPNPQ